MTSEAADHQTHPQGAAAPREALSGPLRIGSHRIEVPVVLAPMAGVTDAAFRAQAAGFGLDLVVSEMVSAGEHQRGNKAARLKARLTSPLSGPGARPSGALVSVQIAGRLASELAETARAAEGDGAAIIDVNMGCPAKKVTSGGAGGSALMRDPDDALRLLDAVRAAVSTPVTVKMRLGWDDETLTGVEIARRAAEAGLSMITVHGRTRAQFYRGAADWAAIRPIVEAAAAPVLANGDIEDEADARRALQLSGAAGVMIGRAAQARPWRPAEIAAALGGAPFTPPSPAEAAALAAAHYEGVIRLYGEEIGARAARKHLGWRLAVLPGGDALRPALLREASPAAVLAALRAFERRLSEEGAPWPEDVPRAEETVDGGRVAGVAAIAGELAV